MSGGRHSGLGRRPLLAGFLGALGLGVAGSLVYETPKLFRHRYKPTPYDGLLAQLDDRDSAVKLGAAVLAEEPHFDAKNAARALRLKIGRGSFAQAVTGDIVHGQLVDVQGWVLPATLTSLAALAALTATAQ
jgi:hypothetical protein